MSAENVQYIIDADLQSLDCTKLLNKGGTPVTFPRENAECLWMLVNSTVTFPNSVM